MSVLTWNNEYKLITSLSEKEIKKRIKDKTIMKGERKLLIQNYLFVRGEFGEEIFTFIPIQLRIPPHGHDISFMPRVLGKIVYDKKGNSIIIMKMKIRGSHIVNFLFASFLFMIGIIAGNSISIEIGVYLLFIIVFWGGLMKYFEYVGKYLVKMFKEFLKIEELPKDDDKNEKVIDGREQQVHQCRH